MPSLTDHRLKIPKYVQLAEYLRGEISSGRFLPDDRLPSLNDLKQQFGANQHTVEKAHTLLETDGLIRREPGRGVFVNHPAAPQKTGNVGFVLPYNMQPEERFPYWNLVLNGVRQAVREHDYHLMLIDENMAFTRWDKMDGVVLCDTRDPRNNEPPMTLPPRDFPAVSVVNKIPGTACITVDDFAGTYQLTQHLIELGHRRIAYLATINSGLSQLEQRKAGYLKALQDAGIHFDPRWMRDLRKREEWVGMPYWYSLAGEYYAHQWLKEDWNEFGCTAIIAQSDDVAKGMIKAFQEEGLRVPADVSVVGFDGLPSYPGELPLTTIQLPLFEMGKQAMITLLDWLDDPSRVPDDRFLPVRLIEAQSSAAVGGGK